MASNTVSRNCETCGAAFLTNNAKIRDGYGRFCSRACFTASRTVTMVPLVCAVCECPYTLPLNQYNSRIKQGHAVKYCSVQCAGKSQERNDRLSQALKTSERLREARPHFVAAGRATKNTPEYREKARTLFREWLSDPAKHERWIAGIRRRSDNPAWRNAPTHLRGPQNPNYIGNNSDRIQAMGRNEYKQWRHEVFKRDDFTCQHCQQHGVKLHAHHIKPWATHPESRYDVSNGLTLCVTCHHTLHNP